MISLYQEYGRSLLEQIENPDQSQSDQPNERENIEKDC